MFGLGWDFLFCRFSLSFDTSLALFPFSVISFQPHCTGVLSREESLLAFGAVMKRLVWVLYAL